MKKFISILSIFIMLQSCKNSTQDSRVSEEQASKEVETTEPNDKHTANNYLKGTSIWKGSINSKYPVTITLSFNNKVIYGDVIYKNSQQPITLLGYRNKDDDFVLQEYYKSADITGIYYAKIMNDSTIEGTWYNGQKDFESQEEMPFALKLQSKTSEPSKSLTKDVTGQYQFKYGGENGASGSIDVGHSGDSIICSFVCTTSGPAFNIATTMIREKITNGHFLSEYQSEDSGLCKFEGFFMPEGVYIRHFGNGNDCGFGHNASLDGIYYKINSTMPDFEKIARELY